MTPTGGRIATTLKVGNLFNDQVTPELSIPNLQSSGDSGTYLGSKG